METNSQSGIATISVIFVFLVGATVGAVVTAKNEEVEKRVENIVPDTETKYGSGE